MTDALQLLRHDHQEVKDLFKRFESADADRAKEDIASKAIVELVIHSMIEEEIFYPAVRRELAGRAQDEEMMFEAEEEHHVADLLIAELIQMDSSDENFNAKFKVMADNVKHHIQEEESLMLPKAAELGGDRLMELGASMLERKTELMQEFKDGARAPARAGRSAHGRKTTGRGRTTTRTRRTGTATTRGRTTARRTTRSTAGRTKSRRTTTARTTTARSTRATATRTKPRRATSARTTTARTGTSPRRTKRTTSRRTTSAAAATTRKRTTAARSTSRTRAGGSTRTTTRRTTTTSQARRR